MVTIKKVQKVKTPKMSFPEEKKQELEDKVQEETAELKEPEEKIKRPRIIVSLKVDMTPEDYQTLQSSGVVTVAETSENTKEYSFQVSKSCEKRYNKTRVLKLSKKSRQNVGSPTF